MRGRLAAVLLIPASAAVQELPLLTSPAAPGCKFESSFIRDTIDFTLFLTPPSSVAKARSQREQYSPYIHAVASTYQQPGRLSISYWPGGWADDQMRVRARSVTVTPGVASALWKAKYSSSSRGSGWMSHQAAGAPASSL
ncbi:MAG: hypothetical protein H0T58_10365 [Gemmatimonadales bacterium]|nr:hypothetical protein [Gemmatimonadales bacterium]